MSKNKKLLLIVIVAILAVSIPVTIVLLHQGQEPSDGGPAEVPSDTPTDEPEVPPTTPSTTLAILSAAAGNVSVMNGGTDSWTGAQVGMSLETGYSVKTGDSSSADITFLDGSTIQLEANTEIEIVSLEIPTDTGSKTIRLKQVIGDTISRVEKLVDSASSYEVETPACVAAVRGSVMLVNVIEDGTTWVTNQEGDIWVIVDGVELQVPEGRKCIILSGQLPQLVPLSGGGGGGGGFSPNPDITITKEPDVTQVHEGDTVTYTYTVDNPGNVPLSSVSVTDNRIGIVPYQSGDTDNDGRLDTDETWIFKATYNITDADDVSPLVNTAEAHGSYAGAGTIIDFVTASVDILRPAIAINKTADSEQAYDGDTITYTYTITNTGNTPLSAISVSDDTIEDVTYQSGDTNEDEILDVDETWVFNATHTITVEDVSPLVNTATVSGADALDRIVSAQASASVTIIRVDIPTYSIRIVLTWDTADTDLDAHFIRPSGVYGTIPGDCFYANENPDWGLSGETEDNPYLDQDDLHGYGTETITLEQPYEQGTYQYKVHYYTDRWHGPSTATVNVWINDVWVGVYSKEMSINDVWNCLSIEWPSGQVYPTPE
jgi:uncharacterized repeat protein (TIGR01451 family)